MAGDNPGMPSGGDNAAVNMAREIETSVKQGNYDSASQKFAQEIQRYSGPQKQVFVRDVLQQLQSKGYHLTEIEIVGENALGKTGAPAARPRVEAPRQPGQQTPLLQPAERQPQYGAPYRGAQPPQTVYSNELPPPSPPSAPAEQYRAPYRGAQPPQTVHSRELPVAPQGNRQVAPGEQVQHPGYQNNNAIAAQTQQAGRIAQEALQLKRHGAGTEKIEDYIRKETTQIYKQHPDWMYGTTPGSFIPELNRRIKQEHIWDEHAHEHAHHPSARHAEHTRAHKQEEVTHHRLVHAHPLLKEKEQLKLEHEGKIKEYMIPKNPRHPKAAVPLHSIAAETLPAKYRTQAYIKERTEELAHLNHLSVDSYFRSGDQLWIPTSKFHEKPASGKSTVPPAEVSEPKRYTYEAPFTPAEKAKTPAEASKATLDQFLKDAKAGSSNLTVEETTKFLNTIKAADATKSTTDQVNTRVNFLLAAAAASNRDSIMPTTQSAVKGLLKIEPDYLKENSEFDRTLKAAGIIPLSFGGRIEDDAKDAWHWVKKESEDVGQWLKDH